MGRGGAIYLLSRDTAQVEAVEVVSAHICRRPPVDPVRRSEVEPFESPGHPSVQTCSEGGRVRSVARRNADYMFGDEVEPELLAVARLKVVSREMDLHSFPRSGDRAKLFT